MADSMNSGFPERDITSTIRKSKPQSIVADPADEAEEATK